jgi:hypothetical protein
MLRRFFGLVILLFVVVLPLSGCVITKVHTVPVEDFNNTYEDVWGGVITYLNREKEPIVVSDKEKGFISTDWVIMQKVFSSKRYRYDIQINKLSETQTRVGIASPQEAYSMGDWESVLPSERRANRIFRYIRELKSSLVQREEETAPKLTGGVGDRPFNKRRR